MNFEQALELTNAAVFRQCGRYLSDIEAAILRGSWHDQTYEQIAEASGYSISYIRRDVGAKFWKLLSQALGETVSKTNFREALRRRWEQPYQFQRQDGVLRQEFITPSHLPTEVQPQPLNERKPSEAPPIYVERPPIESICHDTLLQPGALIRIKAPTLMGKTMLMNRILSQMEEHQYRTTSLSFELADRKNHFTHLDKFLRWFCINLSRNLGLPNQLDLYWDEAGMGSKVSCTTYFEEYLLAADERPLVLCLDKVDLIFPYPEVYEDFFGLLRSWHEKARSRPNWKKLRLVIVHSTDVYIHLNIHQSPFNVGLPIELPELTVEQGLTFAKYHGLAHDLALIKPLMAMVGGHPYLLEQAFLYLKAHPNVSLSRFLQEASTEAGIYANHLRDHWVTAQQQPELMAALKTIMTEPDPVQLEPIQAYQLQSMGLVKLYGNRSMPRCDLYRQYFQSRWGEAA